MTYGIGPLLPLTSVPLVSPNLPQSQESVEVLLLVGDGTGLLGLEGGGESKLSSGGGSLEVLGGRVTLLGLAGLLGEDDQPAPVLLESLDVDLFPLLRPAVPPVVDDDTETLGLLSGNTSLLQLRKGESTTEPDLGVVTDRRGTDGGAEQLKGSDSEVESLLLTGNTPGVLATGLVEPGLDTLLFNIEKITDQLDHSQYNLHRPCRVMGAGGRMSLFCFSTAPIEHDSLSSVFHFDLCIC